MASQQSFVFFNNKGGVGKTFLAYNFAVELAKRNGAQKILIIDMDAQCNISTLCLGGGAGGYDEVTKQLHASKTIKHCLMERLIKSDRGKIDRFTINLQEYRTATWKIDNTSPGPVEELIPSNLHLVCGAADLDIYGSSLESQSYAQAMHGKPTPFYDVYNILRSAIAELDSSWTIIIDTNPSFGLATRLALIAGKELIIPTTLDEFASGGVRNLFLQFGGKLENRARELDPLKRLISLMELLNNNQQSEKIRGPQFGIDREYESLPIAKIRTVVINRYPNKGEREVPWAIRNVEKSFRGLFVKAYVHNTDLFAKPHTSNNEPLDPTLTSEKVVEQFYMHRVLELQGTAQISQNLGLGVNVLGWNKNHKYHMEFINYWDDTEKDESYTAKIGKDSVKYGLQIQDLVEISQGSSWAPAFSLKGKLGQRSFPIVASKANPTAERGGRRLLWTEQCWTDTPWLAEEEEAEETASESENDNAAIVTVGSDNEEEAGQEAEQPPVPIRTAGAQSGARAMTSYLRRGRGRGRGSGSGRGAGPESSRGRGGRTRDGRASKRRRKAGPSENGRGGEALW